jgi:tetratricopeptide (TPR) repeat protein
MLLVLALSTIYGLIRTFLKFDDAARGAAEKIKKHVERFAKPESILAQDDTGPERSVDELLGEFEEAADEMPAAPPAEPPNPKSAPVELIPPSWEVGNRSGLSGRIIPAPPASPPAASPADPALLAAAENEAHLLGPVDLRLARSRFWRALRLEKEGNVRLAMKEYQRVLDLHPATPGAVAARTHLEWIRESRAQKARRLLAKARSLARLASPEEAADDLETILRKYPETPEAEIAEKYLSKLRTSIEKLLK